MRFDMHRIRAADPTYAPGTFTLKGKYVYWRAPRSAISLGYFNDAIKLGTLDDGMETSRNLRAQRLTLDMLQWIEDMDKPKVAPGTWRWIIARYRSDDISPFRDVKDNTKRAYLDDTKYLETAIGDALVEDADFPFLKALQRGMEDRGRSIDFISRKFRMLRIVANYGKQVEPRAFRDVCDVLSVMRLKAPKAKETYPTEAQVMSLVAAADDLGEPGAALGFLLQWWLALRPVDVRGQMLGSKGGALRWADGLTWDMVSIDRGIISKVISKTERSDPLPMTWQIGTIPELVARLDAIPKDQRVGPVIRTKAGRPFTKETYGDIFDLCRTKAGVPAHIKNMDIRAGAINDAKSKGASPVQMQHQANHASLDTTQRYIRGRSDSAAQVIALRTKVQPS